MYTQEKGGGTITIKLAMRNHTQFMLGHRTCGFCLDIFCVCVCLTQTLTPKPFPVLVRHTEHVLSEISLY